MFMFQTELIEENAELIEKKEELEAENAKLKEELLVGVMARKAPEKELEPWKIEGKEKLPKSEWKTYEIEIAWPTQRYFRVKAADKFAAVDKLENADTLQFYEIEENNLVESGDWHVLSVEETDDSIRYDEGEEEGDESEEDED